MTCSKLTSLTRARRIKSLILRLFLGVYCLEGELHGEPLTTILAGDRATLGHIRNIVYPDGCSVSRKGAISQFRGTELAGSGADLVVVGASRLLLSRYRDAGFSAAPQVVNVNLAVNDGPDAIVDHLPGHAREDLRRNIRKMKEKEYQCDITYDEDWFDLFYHHMYKPYALKKYGDLAYLCSYNRVKHDFLHGMGISVQRDGTTVAGAVAYFDGKVSSMVTRQWPETALHLRCTTIVSVWLSRAVAVSPILASVLPSLPMEP